MKILLACSAGMSTSLLERTLNEYMSEKGISGSAEAHDSGSAKQIYENFDVVLLGPQVKFMQREFERLCNGKIPVGVIPPADYAMAKADKVFEYAQSLLGN
ncbi:MAG: PTS sugar transporter subunit IIB [Mycoplasmatales bacterium]|nr:PTS sugar transporter subunit IIB [Mycoplasmatales bacterium]